jgi:hypothetical protein
MPGEHRWRPGVIDEPQLVEIIELAERLDAIESKVSSMLAVERVIALLLTALVVYHPIAASV